MKQFCQLVIKSSEFISRRMTLAENIIKNYNDKNHFIVLPSSDIQYKTRHIPWPFHQDTSFYYYTGFFEKNAALLININSKEVKTSLFIDKPTKTDILWNGKYPSFDQAKDITGINHVLYYNDFMAYVTDQIINKENSMLWTIDNVNSNNFKENVTKLSKLMKRNELNSLIDRQRLIKSPAEIEIMRQAASITAEALLSTFKFTKPFINEQDILAKLFYEINIRGAKLAYPPVIAGGSRANIIHYLNSNQVINDNDLVLVDVGADVLGYYSDVTRTWPVNGKYTPEQAVLYDILYCIHMDCIKECTPERNLQEMYHFMMKQMMKYLSEEGIIKRTSNIHEICPHHIGHYLGLDIHDTPTISTLLPLLPGTVFPLEPGIYFPENIDVINPKYSGIGMRLEDDFAMTESGSLDCLTSGLPRSRIEIETICNEDNNFYSNSVLAK